VETAQNILDEINGLVKINGDHDKINEKLLMLYTIIPRKMSNVKDYLIQPIKDRTRLSNVSSFLSNEQDTLDTMAGQVALLKQQKTVMTDDGAKAKVKNDITILEQMGLSVEVEKDVNTLKLIDKLLGPNKNMAKNIFKVVNHKTQKVFDANLKAAKNKMRRLYWHGSRNENWFNIMQTGLMIRPSGAIHTGSMFGDGIYFADKAQKSIGYSSLSGSYWSRGNSDKGYLALFDVHLGEQKHITHHDSSCYRLSDKVMKDGGHDSVFAHGGADLRNNEYIIYNSNKCTITHIVELSH